MVPITLTLLELKIKSFFSGKICCSKLTQPEFYHKISGLFRRMKLSKTDSIWQVQTDLKNANTVSKYLHGRRKKKSMKDAHRSFSQSAQTLSTNTQSSIAHLLVGGSSTMLAVGMWHSWQSIRNCCCCCSAAGRGRWLSHWRAHSRMLSLALKHTHSHNERCAV